MAPPTGALRKPSKEEKATAILSFGDELIVLLSTSGEPKITVALTDRLEQQLRSFPSSLGTIAAQKYRFFDGKGTELWNLCARFRRNNEFNKLQNNAIVTVMIRIYAFLMLDSAQTSPQGTFPNAIRVMKLSLKTAKNCLELKQLDFALKVLEKAAVYESELCKATDLSTEDAETCGKLSSEYFIVRTLLEWRQDRFEIAEHMFNKAGLPARRLDPTTAESLSDLLFEMGKELHEKKQHELAVKWLTRAYNIMVEQELDRLSVDASELRTSIVQCSIKALLGLEREDAIDEARNLVSMLESEVGDKLIVLLLKLEILSVSNETFESSDYATLLQRIIRTVVVTEPNFKLIMHHIRKLNDKSPSIACQVLDEFLQSRILQADNQQWIEALLVSRIWMSTGQRDGQDVLCSVERILEKIASNINVPISTEATHACQMLFWKRIEASSSLGQHHTAEMWCRLALHNVFQNAGELNKAKITRKLLLCALTRHDVANAREIFGSMPISAKDDPMTRFLMYKVAIRGGDVVLASECLAIVYNGSSKDSSLLYACVLDAQEIGDDSMAIEALQLVLGRYDHNVQSTIHLPALLRVTIRLYKCQVEANETCSGPEAEGASAAICKLFEAATTFAKKQLSGESVKPLFTMDELDWFSKNSYNLALKYSSTWKPTLVLRLIDTCTEFIDLYPKGVTQQLAGDLSLRRVFCDFLATVLLISLARAEDNIELQLQYYLTIRRHVDRFDETLQEKLDRLDEDQKEDLVRKLSILLAYDFEAACHLKNWDGLANVILKADACKSMKVYELMADCILSCEAPSHVVVPNLKRIVNAAWELEHCDISKLSRYMRCLFQYALPQNDSVAETLLDQIHTLAQDASESEIPYPAEELEWIATTSFNRGIDFYCLGEDDQCRNWSGKAMNIASFLPDGGALQNLLEQKLLGLNFSKDK